MTRTRPYRAQKTARALLIAIIVCCGVHVSPMMAANSRPDTDLSCAADYTLAALALQTLDTDAAMYYEQRATAAGKRYLQTHPSETEQTYAAHVIARARNLQEQLTLNTLSPGALADEITQCEKSSESAVAL